MNVVVAGALGQRPGVGGHAWVLLQYLLGFERLGCDVLFLDRATHPGAAHEEASWAETVLGPFGLGDRYTMLVDGYPNLGLPRSEVLARTAGSLLINVMGYLEDDELLNAARTTVFLDIDPGFGQMWRELGLADIFGDHDHHLTVGMNVGGPDCDVPTCGIAWTPTRPPVVLEHWPVLPARPGAPITAIASWRGPFEPIRYLDRTYGLRVHEFRKFFGLPDITGDRFELALDIAPAEPDIERLRATGWTLVDPRVVAPDPWRYRSHIQGSKAELMVAKHLYVATRSGWFSDRSVCYLASGRPVVAQDTGWAGTLPVGKGLLAFSTPAKAAEAVTALDDDYEGHRRAARWVAEEYFDSDVVLTELLANVGAS